MRCISVFLLAVVFCSSAQAISIGFEIDSGSVVAAGETIHINVVSDTACEGLIFGAVVESLSLNSTGQAEVVTVMNGIVNDDAVTGALSWGTVSADLAGYNNSYNGVGCLFDWSEGSAGPAATAGSVLASFSYTIDSAWDGSAFYIAPLATDLDYLWDTGSWDTARASYGGFAGSQEVLISGVQIVPEPMTIALLGLGSLFLRQGRKATLKSGL